MACPGRITYQKLVQNTKCDKLVIVGLFQLAVGSIVPWSWEHPSSLIVCFHPPDDYNTEVADNLEEVDVGTAEDNAAADGEAVVQNHHLQGSGHPLDWDLQPTIETTSILRSFQTRSPNDCFSLLWKYQPDLCSILKATTSSSDQRQHQKLADTLVKHWWQPHSAKACTMMTSLPTHSN